VRLYARVALLLGGYLLVAGLIYGTSNKERIGLVLLLVAAGGFTYLGTYARRAVRAAERAARKAAEAEPGGPPDTTEPEVRPTIWPLVFSLAGAGIVAGVLASHWILAAGALLAVAAASGWFLEVLAQRQEHH
jgi:Cytochrome c oxidase subunit IV